MANKQLSSEEFVATVDFYQALLSMDNSVFEGMNVSKRRAIGAVLGLLGYVMIDGKHVDKDTYASTTYRFGERPEFTDDLPAAYAAAKEALNETTDKDTHRPETDSREPTKGSSLRKALLREDV